jgi:hypothetical protein
MVTSPLPNFMDLLKLAVKQFQSPSSLLYISHCMAVPEIIIGNFVGYKFGLLFFHF